MITKCNARFVVGYDPKRQNHVIYSDGEVVFDGDSVIFAGRGYMGVFDRALSFPNSMICPGFVDLNAACDIDTTVLEFESERCSNVTMGKIWSEAYLRKGPHELTSPEENARKSYYALVQLIRRGTTTAMPVTGLQYRRWAETKEEFAGIAHMAAKLGLRTYLGPSYRSGVQYVRADGKPGVWWDEDEGRRGLEDCVSFIREYDGAYNGLIHGAMIPSTIETLSGELLKKTQRCSQELKVPVRLHATQSTREVAMMHERYGASSVQVLDRFGLLNRQLLLPHAVYLEEEEGKVSDVDLLARSGCTVLHCPFVLARHGTAMRSFSRFKAKGIRIALATDCYPPDMFRNMYMATVMCRFAESDPSAANVDEVYRSATIDAADALGRPDLGRLCPGSKADMIVVDLSGFHMGQIANPITTAVLNGSGMDVTDVFINGRDVMRGRSIPGVDFDELHQWSQGYFQKLRSSYTERDYMGRSEEELFGSGFLMDLGNQV